MSSHGNLKKLTTTTFTTNQSHFLPSPLTFFLAQTSGCVHTESRVFETDCPGLHLGFTTFWFAWVNEPSCASPENKGQNAMHFTRCLTMLFIVENFTFVRYPGLWHLLVPLIRLLVPSSWLGHFILISWFQLEVSCSDLSSLICLPFSLKSLNIITYHVHLFIFLYVFT